MDFLKSHYEKIILTTTLVAFIGALIYLVGVITVSKPLSDEFRKITKKTANYAKESIKFDAKELNVIENLSEADLWKESVNRGNDSFRDHTDLLVPIETAFSPYEIAKLIPLSDFTVSKKDSFTGKKLEAPVFDINDIDMDQDQIPDAIEIKFGTDPKIADSHLDLDKDSFSNLDEYRLYETKMNDAKSRPAYGVKYIELAEINRSKLPITLESISNGLIQVRKLTINPINDKEYMKTVFLEKSNPEFMIGYEKYIIIDFEVKEETYFDESINLELTKKKSFLTIQKASGGEKIVMEEKEQALNPIAEVVIKSNPEYEMFANEFTIKRGESFKIGNEDTGFDSFTLISVNKNESIKIKDSKDKEFEIKLK